MTEMTMPCPFSKRACVECALYRGRHHYLCFSGQQQGSTERQKKRPKSGVLPFFVEFQALIRALEPCTGKHSGRKSEPKIRLKVIDMESRTTRICSVDELKEWDWGNPRICRLIEGRQITNFDSLVEILCYKAETGCEEVELHEVPRFMLLAGG